jgi:hypothetical protein
MLNDTASTNLFQPLLILLSSVGRALNREMRE